MTELPMITSAPPAKASGKATNTESANQDNQGFGNVLARQVADSDKPAPAKASEPSPGNTGKSSSPEENPETSAAAPADGAASIPADMLAALLAQQSPVVAQQAQTVASPVINKQAETNPPLSSDVVAAENPFLSAVKDEKPALSPLAALPGAINRSAALPDKANLPIEATNNPGKQFADQIKIAAAKDLSPSSVASSAKGNIANELSSPIAPTGFMPLLAGASPTAINHMQVNTPVTQPAWGDEFSQKITWLTSQKNQSAELHLNPPQLGPLDVVLKINGDQASALFTSPHAAVRDAIEQALPKLREMLADNGIMLGNAMVSDQASKNDQHTASRKTQDRSAGSVEGTAEADTLQEVRVSSISRHNGMVDTFA